MQEYCFNTQKQSRLNYILIDITAAAHSNQSHSTAFVINYIT